MCLRWTLTCLARWSERENLLSHSLHGYGRTPECERRCLASSSDLEKRQSQPGHVQTNGFSPVWRRRCAFRCELLLYVLWHFGYVQQCCRSSANCDVGDTGDEEQDDEPGDGMFPFPEQTSWGMDVDRITQETTVERDRGTDNDAVLDGTCADVQLTCSVDLLPTVRQFMLRLFSVVDDFTSNQSRLSKSFIPISAESVWLETATDRKQSGWITWTLLLFRSLQTSSWISEHKSCDKQQLLVPASCVDVISFSEFNVISDCDIIGPTTAATLCDVSENRTGSSLWVIRCRSPTPSTTIQHSASGTLASVASRSATLSSNSEKYPPPPPPQPSLLLLLLLLL